VAAPARHLPIRSISEYLAQTVWTRKERITSAKKKAPFETPYSRHRLVGKLIPHHDGQCVLGRTRLGRPRQIEAEARLPGQPQSMLLARSESVQAQGFSLKEGRHRTNLVLRLRDQMLAQSRAWSESFVEFSSGPGLDITSSVPPNKGDIGNMGAELLRHLRLLSRSMRDPSISSNLGPQSDRRRPLRHRLCQAHACSRTANPRIPVFTETP